MNTTEQKSRTPDEKLEKQALSLAVHHLMQEERPAPTQEDKNAAVAAEPRIRNCILRSGVEEQLPPRRGIRDYTQMAVKVAAMLLLTLEVGGSVAFAASGDIRVKFLDYVTTTTPIYMDITYQTAEVEALMPEDWETNYFPSYIPEGYVLTKHASGEDFGFLEYQNEAGVLLDIDIGGPHSGVTMNTEGATIETIMINNTTATVLYQPYDRVHIVWAYGDRFFIIDACDYETALDAAVGMKIIQQ